MPGSNTSPFMLDVSNMVDERIESAIFRAVVTAVQPDAVRIKRVGAEVEDDQNYAAVDIYPFPEVDDEVLVLKVGKGFNVLGRIVRSGLDVLHTTLSDLEVTGTIQVGPSVRLTPDGLALVVTDTPTVVGDDDKKISHVSEDYLTTYGERFGVWIPGLGSSYLVDRVMLATDSYIWHGIWDDVNDEYDMAEVLTQSTTGFFEVWAIFEGISAVLGLHRNSATDWELWLLSGGVYQQIA